MSVTRTKPVAERARRNDRALDRSAEGAARRDRADHAARRWRRFPDQARHRQTVTVEADIFTDGHDIVAAELLWKAADEKDWTRVPLAPLGNDRWQATFTPTRIGRHLFTVEAWRDDYASLCHEIEVKHKAGVDIALELTEARQISRSRPCQGRPLQHHRAGQGDRASSKAATPRPACRRSPRPRP